MAIAFYAEDTLWHFLFMRLHDSIVHMDSQKNTDPQNTDTGIHEEIIAYNSRQAENRSNICEILAHEIHGGLGRVTTNKLWHGHPVWFIDGNPIVGYDVLKESVRLLFWSGQSFDELGLTPEGSFKAADARYTSPEQINTDDIARWLKKSKTIQWDYKNIVKRRGVLERLK